MINKFGGKKIALLGWGVDTEDAVQFLLDSGTRITVFDRKKELGGAHKKYKTLTWRLGKEDFGDLSSYDLIVRNPAVYRYRPEIVAAEKAGVEISSKVKLFFDLCSAKIIGVTGTKGKGTTATLIYEMLKAADKKVFLGGNIGQGVFQFLPKLDQNSWVVLELSSFQLIDLTKSPHIAVVLMVTTEHQDWHKSPEEYINAKKPIFAFQTKVDFAVINKDYPNSVKIGNVGNGKKFLVSGSDIKNIIDPAKIRLRGRHNWENIVAAATAAKLAGVENDLIQKVIGKFPGLEHRLEEVATVNGATYYNDSFSTTPETAIAAIKSFSEPEILILGGSEKGADFSELGKTIVMAGNVKAAILIGLMADRIEKAIKQAIPSSNLKIIRGTRNMAEIVKMAYNIAKSGDIVLLSPAAASFDMFRNYKDRGRQFKDQVLKLKDNEQKNHSSKGKE